MYLHFFSICMYVIRSHVNLQNFHFHCFRARIPVSNAVTAMEVWLLACMMLVFFSLVEYTIILKKGVSHNRNLERIKKETTYIKASNGVSGLKFQRIKVQRLGLIGPESSKVLKYLFGHSLAYHSNH